MRKLIPFLFFAAIFLAPSSCFSQTNQVESLTITTYYPSPYGVYGILRLNPRTRLGTCKEGEMTYDSDPITKGLYFCGSSGWSQLSSGGFWVENSATHYISNVNTGGRVGIGTATPADLLEVNGGIRAASIRASGTIQATGSLTAGSLTTASIQVNGNMVTTGSTTANAFYYSSDRALKKNVRPLSGSLEKITRLQGKAFQWQSDNRDDIGLVAQEVEGVYPELVYTDRNSGLKSVEYGNLIAVLIEAVKEQQKQIQQLKAEIAGFKK